jgi:hypothetical protein
MSDWKPNVSAPIWHQDTQPFEFETKRKAWKEKYFNFFIEYHFNDHSLEKINSGTWFMNGKKLCGYYNIIKIVYFLS